MHLFIIKQLLNINGKWMFNSELDGEWGNKYCESREDAISKGMDYFKSIKDFVELFIYFNFIFDS